MNYAVMSYNLRPSAMLAIVHFMDNVCKYGMYVSSAIGNRRKVRGGCVLEKFVFMFIFLARRKGG